MRITGCDLHALSGLLSSIVATVARPHPQEKDHQLPPWQALGAMRTINTLQGAAFQEPRHQYLSLDELVSQAHRNVEHEQWLTTLPLLDNSAGTLKNYRVSVVVSPDRQHYAAQLISSSSCGLAVFSDEYGIIYTARGMGCPQEKPL